jgi:hypothetical protein
MNDREVDLNNKLASALRKIAHLQNKYQQSCKNWRELVQVKEYSIAELEVIVKAVAHIGVNFGYGVYEIENKHIEDSRQYFLTKGGDA